MALTSEEREAIRIARSNAARKAAKKGARLDRIMERELEDVTKNGRVFASRPEPTKRREGTMFTCKWEGCNHEVASNKGLAAYCVRLDPDSDQTHRQMYVAKKREEDPNYGRKGTTIRRENALAARPQPPVPMREDIDDDVIVVDEENIWDRIATLANDIKQCELEESEAKEHYNQAANATERAKVALRGLYQESGVLAANAK